MGIIDSFIDSLTIAEQSAGVYNFTFLGIVIEHPFIFWILIPLFLVGLLLGLIHARISGIIIVIAFSVVVMVFLSMIGWGIPGADDLLAFFLSLPVIFTIGCTLGGLLRYVLRNACRDRKGGLLCKLV